MPVHNPVHALRHTTNLPLYSRTHFDIYGNNESLCGAATFFNKSIPWFDEQTQQTQQRQYSVSIPVAPLQQANINTSDPTFMASLALVVLTIINIWYILTRRKTK